MGDPRPVGSPRLLGPRGCRPDLSARTPFARLSLVPPDLTRDPEARLPATPYLLVLAERGRRALRLRLGDPLSFSRSRPAPSSFFLPTVLTWQRKCHADPGVGGWGRCPGPRRSGPQCPSGPLLFQVSGVLPPTFLTPQTQESQAPLL